MRNLLRHVFRGLVACILAVAAGGALAQEFPSKPLRIILHVPPGSGTDLITRAIGAGMSLMSSVPYFCLRAASERGYGFVIRKFDNIRFASRMRATSRA